MKAMLASDWDETKVMFPVWAQPKIDGVRAFNPEGRLLSRRLKAHKNLFVTQQFSHPDVVGMDGEMAAQSETHPDLCRLTTSALGTIKGEPFVLWWLFDCILPATQGKIYAERYEYLQERLSLLQQMHARWATHLRLVPYQVCRTMDELESADRIYLEAGYEGTIIRDPYGLHKQGRSTPRERGLLRIKRFLDAEAVVVRYEEGQQNGNEAQINELGRQYRTTHADGMIPNGQVGTIVCRKVDSEEIINVSPGAMPLDERKYEWENRHAAPGKVFTYKHFPKGVKDKPRFPTWKSWRDDLE